MSVKIKVKEYDSIDKFIEGNNNEFAMVAYESRHCRTGLSRDGLIKFETETGLQAVYVAGGSKYKKDGMYSIYTESNFRLQFLLSEDLKMVFTQNEYIPDILTGSRYLDYSVYMGNWTDAISDKVNEYCFNRILEEVTEVKYEEELIEEYEYTAIKEIKDQGSYNVKGFYPNISLNRNYLVNDIDIIHKMLIDEEFFKEMAEKVYVSERDDLINLYFRGLYKIKIANKLKEELRPDIEEHIKLKEILKDYKDCKTLNIVKDNGESHKVENLLLSDFRGSFFRTVKGYNTITLNEISKLTYGKTILFSRQ